MTNYWNKQDVPHKGWYNQGYEDLEQAIHVCDMCGKEEIRYVHTMYHPHVDDYFKVGEVCAGKMTNDYTLPQKQLKMMKHKSNWMVRNWKRDIEFDYEEKSFNSIFGRSTVGIIKVDDVYIYHIDDRLNRFFEFKTVKEIKEHLYKYYLKPVTKRTYY